jgi:hypothetical protein
MGAVYYIVHIIARRARDLGRAEPFSMREDETPAYVIGWPE